MKKILSVLLSLCMIISLFSAFAIIDSAAEAVYASDEYDAAELGFGISVTDARGLKAGWCNPDAKSSDIDEVYNKESYNDEFGKHQKDGTLSDSDWVYEVMDYSIWLTEGKSDYVCGGFWNVGENARMAINQFPIDIDINLGEAREVSGVRVYADTKKDTGIVKKYKVYVKFDGEEDWTYLYTDSNNSNAKLDLTTPFAGNMNVTDIRIRVLESSSTAGAGTGAGGPAYFYLNKVAVLKPYNSGSADYASGKLMTYNSSAELDELPVSATTAKFQGDGWSEAASMRGMDDDLGTSIATNGSLTVNFGKAVSFSGIRYYPPKNAQADGKTFKAIKSIGALQILPDGFTLDSTNKVSFSSSEDILPEIGSQFVYPTVAAGVSDITKPITLKFGRNVTAKGLYINAWTHADGSASGSGGVGEIRLLKEETLGRFDEYYAKDDVLHWSNDTVPSVTGRGKTGESGTIGGSKHSLFDKTIYFVGDAGAPDANNSRYAFTNDFCLQNGGTAWFTVDLGEEYTFSALRMFPRFGQPAQSISEGILYFSDDGVTWSDGFRFEDTYTEDHDKKMAKYNSTGDYYADMGVTSNGVSYNVTARYVKIEAVKSTSDHFAAQEIMLVKPKAENEIKDVAGLIGLSAEKAAAVDALIDAIGTVDENSGAKIEAARAAYDALSAYAKTLVTKLSVLTAAEEAYAVFLIQSIIDKIDALPEAEAAGLNDAEAVDETYELYDALPEDSKTLVTNSAKLLAVKSAISGLIFTVNVSTPENYYSGLMCAEFTLTVPEGTTVSKLVVRDNEYTEAEGWFEQTTEDGKIKLKLTGTYDSSTYANWGAGTVGSALNSGIKVWARQDIPAMGLSNGDEITFGKGKLTNEIIHFNPVGGDNFIKVSLSDGSERVVNIKTTNLSFTDITNPGFTGATDELVPDTSWKAASTTGGWIQRALDGVYDSTSADKYWETNYVPGSYQIEGSSQAFNVIYYVPAPYTFYLDLGDNETDYSGMRFYPRKDSVNSNVGKVDVYGTDDLYGDWTLIGSYDLTSQDKTKALNIIFFEDEHTVNYKYLRCNVTSNFNGSGNMNIAEIAVLKPAVGIIGADTYSMGIGEGLTDEAKFTFNMKTATALTSVKKGGTEVDASAYNFDTDKLTFTVDYANTLPEGKTEFVLTFDNGDKLKVYIEKIELTVAEYYITGTKSGTSINGGRGTDSLLLTAPGSRQASKLEIGSYKMDFTQEGNQITVARYDFRGYEALFDAYRNDGFVKIKATFTDGSVIYYTVNLYGATYKLTNEFLDASKFASDEIVSKTTWDVKVDSDNYGSNVAIVFGHHDWHVQWHSGFSEVGGDVVADTTKGHYMDIDLGEVTEFSGLRYYRRNDGITGVWQEVTVYGRNSENENWTVIKDKTALKWDYSNETYKDIAFDGTAQCRYVRIKITGSSHATTRYLRLLKPKASFKKAEVLNDPVPMDFDLNENANAKLSLGDSRAVKKVMQDGREVASEYLEIAGDVISISPYYFIDNEYESGDEVEFTVSFAFGDDVSFKVELGSVDGYVFTYSAGANGKVTAQAYNETIGVPEDKASGDKVRNTDKLTFTAIPEEGYMVDSWTVVSTTPIYEKVPDSQKKHWSVEATSQHSGSVSKMIDGNDNPNQYWHSNYKVVDGTPEPDPPCSVETPYVLTFDFGGTVKAANSFSYIPRKVNGSGVKDYKLYVLEEGNGDWTLIKTGTLERSDNLSEEITFDFGGVYDITKLKYEITSTYESYAFICEVYISSEKLPSGMVTRVGAGSEDFVIDDRFTNMAVTATFKEMADGTASIVTNLTHITSDAPATASWGEDLVIKLTPESGYHAPLAEKLSVTKDGVDLVAGVDYIYVRTSDVEGTLTLKNVYGKKLVINATAKDYLNHKVYYVDNYGATGSLPKSEDVIEGETITVKKSSLKLTGYKFVGWTYDDVVYKAGDQLTMSTYDIIFESVWEKDSSQEDAPGGVNKPSLSGGSSNKKPSSLGGGIGAGTSGGAAVAGSITVTVDGVATKVTAGNVIPEPAEKEGYTFAGYYLDEALTIPYANTGIQSSITLYPSWVKNRSRADLTDISGHWAENYIGSLYESFLINGTGDGKFNPDSDITRAEFVQILYNMSKMTSDGSQNFDDVKSGDWFSQAVAWAVNYGITSGTGDKTFSPYEKITREQMATMIYRYAVLMGADWQTEENAEFDDNADIADFAKYQVRWAKGNGIISGRPDGSFGPKDNATRAESAAMLSRLVK